MTKMQIIAKTTLTVLGIYAVVTLYSFYPGIYIMYRREGPAMMKEVISLSSYAVLAGFIVYFTIFNNNGLSKRLAGAGEKLEPQNQVDWMVKSLRVGLVFAGLMLLSGSISTVVKIPKIFFLIRPAINDIIISKSVPKILMLSYSEWFRNIYGFSKAMLAIYLICGAPHFICWQLEHTLRRESNIEKTGITDPSICNSERGENE